MKSLRQMEQCVDLTTLDAQFQRACCSQSNYISLNNGFSSSGYDWIGTACSASYYNVSNARSIINCNVRVFHLLALPYLHNPPVLHPCLLRTLYSCHRFSTPYFTHSVSNAAFGHLLAHSLALPATWVLCFASRLHTGEPSLH